MLYARVNHSRFSVSCLSRELCRLALWPPIARLITSSQRAAAARPVAIRGNACRGLPRRARSRASRRTSVATLAARPGTSRPHARPGRLERAYGYVPHTSHGGAGEPHGASDLLSRARLGRSSVARALAPVHWGGRMRCSGPHVEPFRVGARPPRHTDVRHLDHSDSAPMGDGNSTRNGCAHGTSRAGARIAAGVGRARTTCTRRGDPRPAPSSGLARPVTSGPRARPGPLEGLTGRRFIRATIGR